MRFVNHLIDYIDNADIQLLIKMYFQGANGSMEYLNKSDRKHREINRYSNNARYNIMFEFFKIFISFVLK